MEGNARAFDDPRTWVYRRHVLGGLERIHVNVYGGPRPRFESIRAWDKAVVVPRWGFDSVQHYWDSQSSGPRLGDIELPVLFVATEGDPMVPSATLRPHLERGQKLRGDLLDVVWLDRGGHVGFPPKLNLGLPGEPGLMNQVIGWLEAR
jgi:predicted alpha/beta-fold hydrolase